MKMLVDLEPEPQPGIASIRNRICRQAAFTEQINVLLVDVDNIF